MKPQKLPLLAALFSALSSTPSFAEPLKTHAEVKQTGHTYHYTLFNDEPAASPLFLTSWHLSTHGAFSILKLPQGWTCETDHSTSLDCANTDQALPYPHDIPPGSVSPEFILRSKTTTSTQGIYTISSWDHGKDDNGPSLDRQGSEIPVPYDPSLPEGE